MRRSACSHPEYDISPAAMLLQLPCKSMRAQRRRGLLTSYDSRYSATLDSAVCSASSLPAKRSSCSPHILLITKQAGATRCSRSREGGAHPGWGRGSGPPLHSPASSLPRRQSQTLPGWRPPGPCRGVRLSCCLPRVRTQSTGLARGALLYGECGGFCARSAEALCTAPTTFHNTCGTLD